MNAYPSSKSNCCAILPSASLSSYLFIGDPADESLKSINDLCVDAFLYKEPMSCIGSWPVLEQATCENGYLQVIPKGHKNPLQMLEVVIGVNRELTSTKQI